MDRNIKEILKQLSEKYNLPQKIIKDIVYSQFRYLKISMDNEQPEPLQFLGLGKFQLIEKKYKSDVARKVGRDNYRLRKLTLQKEENREASQTENETLQQMPIQGCEGNTL